MLSGMEPVDGRISWDELRAVVKASAPTHGVRAAFVDSIRQSLRVEGIDLSEAEVRRAVEHVVAPSK
jgi:hypothetical protein